MLKKIKSEDISARIRYLKLLFNIIAPETGTYTGIRQRSRFRVGNFVLQRFALKTRGLQRLIRNRTEKFHPLCRRILDPITRPIRPAVGPATQLYCCVICIIIIIRCTCTTTTVRLHNCSLPGVHNARIVSTRFRRSYNRYYQALNYIVHGQLI